MILMALAQPVFSADAPAAPDAAASPVQLPGIQVTSTRPSVEMDIPGTTSVIDHKQMTQHLVSNIRNLVRYEPGVSAIGTAGRFGLDSFNIRGLSGNRTYMEVDGVPVAGSFGADVAGGGFRAGRNFIDIDDIKQVEIIRGPASALYPSNALGGAVIVTTRDPADYLRPGRTFHASVKEQYDGADRSFDTSVSLAAGTRRNGFLVMAHHRDGHETRNRGDVGGSGAARTRPDPMAYTLDGVLGEYVHTADSGRVDRFSLDASRSRTRTNGLSQLVPEPHEGFVPDYYLAHDRGTRLRASIGQSFPGLESGVADTLDWHVYWQRSRTLTGTLTDTPTVVRHYDSMPLQERVLGGKLVVTRAFDGDDGAAQVITYGVAASRTNAQSCADGYGVDKQSGAVGKNPPFLPGSYPLHLFPESNTDRFALFGQDRIALFDGRLVVTPGVRVERYAYRPEADALYLAHNRGYVQRDYTRTNVSPKLGAIWHFGHGLGVYADYASGFRPPLYSEIAGAWNEQPVPGINIAFLPSPELKAETSRNAEIGLRGMGASGWFNLAAYYNRYSNFIWSGYRLPAAQVPPWAYRISPGAFYNAFYQAVNAPRAVIKGVEASAQLQLGSFAQALDGWSLHGAAAIASGELIEPGKQSWSPLNTVDPAKLVLGIRYDGDGWGAELVGTAVRRHTRLDDPSLFRPAGYGVLDFYAHWRPDENIAVYFGARNLANRKYWDWGNLNGGMLGNLLSGNGVNDAGTGGIPTDRLSMPGRTFSASIRFSF